MIAFDKILDLARRHAPEAKAVTQIFDQGWRHVAYEIDHRLVLKLRRPNAPDELERETLVLAHLQTAGLPTPRLVGAGQDSELGRYNLTERVPGAQASELADQNRDGLVRQAAQFAAALHRVDTTGLSRQLRKQDVDGMWSNGIAWLIERKHITAAQGQAADDAFLRMRDRFSTYSPVLLHGDLWGTNLFVDERSGLLTGVIDFGDAAIGPRGWELGLPGGFDDRWSPSLLKAYDDANGHPAGLADEVRFYQMVRRVGVAAFTDGWAKPKYWDEVLRTSIRAAIEAANT